MEKAPRIDPLYNPNSSSLGRKKSVIEAYQFQPRDQPIKQKNLCEANKQGIELRESRVRAFVFLLGTRSKRMHWMDARAEMKPLCAEQAYTG
ncbi:hypothetical protein KIW84_072147 [Lathyrus oleraceus]|uniref:Uncharacterized protein n=1 Tax=Pisum sativum TaxID=3888 RepID=A0A9D4ZWT3_PEA|nr:hypothetical protein KIW84_072147 [Pisum sativum]